MIPVLILAEHKLVREGWVKFLSAQQDIFVIGDAADVEDGCRLLNIHQPHIALFLAINSMPALLLKQLTRIHYTSAGTHIILVTADFPYRIQEYLGRVGVRACLSKHSSLNEILTAIVKVNGGKTYTSAAFLLEPEIEEYTSNAKGTDLLTERELQIASLLVSGITSSEVAEMLNISRKTIEVHRHNILKKMKCKNTAMLVNKLFNAMTS